MELFFKWVKQHLKIKKFWGDSENAVRIHMGISLTDTKPLEDLFNKSNLNIDKELDGFYEPTLFDF